MPDATDAASGCFCATHFDTDTGAATDECLRGIGTGIVF
jgi:hypothetical protein